MTKLIYQEVIKSSGSHSVLKCTLCGAPMVTFNRIKNTEVLKDKTFAKISCRDPLHARWVKYNKGSRIFPSFAMPYIHDYVYDWSKYTKTSNELKNSVDALFAKCLATLSDQNDCLKNEIEEYRELAKQVNCLDAYLLLEDCLDVNLKLSSIQLSAEYVLLKDYMWGVFRKLGAFFLYWFSKVSFATDFANHFDLDGFNTYALGLVNSCVFKEELMRVGFPLIDDVVCFLDADFSIIPWFDLGDPCFSQNLMLKSDSIEHRFSLDVKKHANKLVPVAGYSGFSCFLSSYLPRNLEYFNQVVAKGLKFVPNDFYKSARHKDILCYLFPLGFESTIVDEILKGKGFDSLTGGPLEGGKRGK